MHMTVDYNSTEAVEYAKKWALDRNKTYLNFDSLGGDCTNFVSQCLFAGSGVMNYEKDIGWYYKSPYDRAAAWSGSNYLFSFLLGNNGVGPVGRVVPIKDVKEGDLIFLNNGSEYYHSLIVCGFIKGMPLVCAHSDDSLMRGIDSYHFVSATGVHIINVRKW